MSNPGIASGFTDQGDNDHDNLIAGELHRVTRLVTVAGGADLARGALLGRITSGGNYILSLSAAGDGSEVPRAILAEAAAASGGNVQALVYETGEFNELAMTFGTAHTAATTSDGLRGLGIHLQQNLGA